MAERVTEGKIRAAGGVLWRTVAGTNGDIIEVAVIHRPRYDDWSIPKGKLNVGEIDLEGAVREVTEETGFRPTIVSPLGKVEYLKDGRPKVVRYWSMRAGGGVFTSGREVDELRWLNVEDAIALVSTDRDRDLLRRFSDTPSRLRTVLLVRHGSAGSRSGWNGKDAERPLDEAGQFQANALIWLLTCWDVREIHSAPIRRCTETIEPLAAAVGLSVRSEKLLDERVFLRRRLDAIDWIRDIAHEDTATVLCSQGDVIPDALATIALEDGCELRPARSCKKGSMWALTFAGRQLHAAEYFPPLA
jgi:8-oxo-dGTP diphosphatase